MNKSFNKSIVFFVLGLLCFTMFAYEMEYKRDFISWFWITGFIFFWLNSFAIYVTKKIEKIINEKNEPKN